MVRAISGLVCGLAVAAQACASADFAMMVMDVFKVSGQGVVLTGRIESGQVQPGDHVCLGGGHALTVKALQAGGRSAESAGRGEIVGILVDGVAKEDVAKGEDRVTASCGGDAMAP